SERSERNPWSAFSRPGGAKDGCHGWSEQSERNPWKASPTWIPPRRGGGWLPRVERAQRAQPVVSGAQSFSRPGGAKDGCHGWSERSERNPWSAVRNLFPAPEGRKMVATGGASA